MTTKAAEIVSAIKAGSTCLEIIKTLGVTRNYVWYVAKRHGLKVVYANSGTVRVCSQIFKASGSRPCSFVRVPEKALALAKLHKEKRLSYSVEDGKIIIEREKT